MNKAKINEWLDVGNCHSCPDDAYRCVIHIFRTDVSDADQQRYCVHPSTRHNMKMDYKDGHVIDHDNLHNLHSIAELIRKDKYKTLIHCHAGMCRSPTIAILLLVLVDDMNPYDAQHLVTKAIHEQRGGTVCHINYDPFKQIVRLWEGTK